MDHDKVAIVGGGIAGLTTAIALQRKGFQVVVYESAPEMQPLGAGLALAANAVNAFSRIGISEAVLKAGKVLKVMRIRDEAGHIITETDSEKLTARFGIVNNFTIHRADLHEVLISQLAPGTLILNKRCTGCEQTSQSVSLTFSDGTRADADYVIACDGIHSAIRKKVLPHTAPRYAGYTCWRGLTDHVPPGANPDETTETWGSTGRFGIVPLANHRIYWFACVNAPENDPGMRAWQKDDLLRRFGHFHAPVKELLESTPDERIIWNDIIDLKPIKRFAFGRIVLTGDAAHATTPNMGQGACMAIEDAAVLADCMAEAPSPSEAFRAFERKRIGRTTAIVNKSWTIGKVAQLENRFLVKVRNALVRRTPASVTENQIRALLQDS